MRLSNMGFKSVKLENVDEQYPAQDILVKTGQLYQYESGIYAYHHIPYLLQKNVERIIAQELALVGCVQVSLPILQPSKIWQESDRWNKYISDGTMFVVQTDKSKYGLAPTAEEAVVKFAANRLNSYKNLPVTFFQIGEKFRNEIRARGVLLRGKSFYMMDAYSFNVSEHDLDQSYEVMKQAYYAIFKRLGLQVTAVAADNGAIGGSKSEEFMMLSDIGEDTILFDEKTGFGFNQEVLERSDCKSYLKTQYQINDTEHLQEKRAMELGHIFKLGQKYSETMKATFINENDQPQPYQMGCYGIGVSRVVAMLYESSILKDQKRILGISLPVEVAPYQFHIVVKNDNEARMLEANQLYGKLLEQQIPVLIDDRVGESVGSKMKDCKVLGTPYMLVFGDKLPTGSIEVEYTLTNEKKTMSTEQFMKMAKKMHV